VADTEILLAVAVTALLLAAALALFQKKEEPERPDLTVDELTDLISEKSNIRKAKVLDLDEFLDQCEREIESGERAFTQPFIWVNDADQLEFIASPDQYRGQYISPRLTLYRSAKDDKVIGLLVHIGPELAEKLKKELNQA
jgi:hypothetical protein